MARILITTFGSYGDLFPYLAIGVELRRRGHGVTIGTSEVYRARIEAEGLEFAPVRPNVDLGDRELLEQVFDARRGSERVISWMASVVRESYEDTLGPADHADLIVTHPLSFAAVLIAKKRRLPWASTVLAPISFISVFDPPVLAPVPWLRQVPFTGPRFYRWLYNVGRRKALEWTQPVSDLGRAELGLTVEEIGNPVFEGSHSPSLMLALFSPLFGAPQADWPANTVATGFPFFVRAGGEAQLAPELEEFLKAGPAPVVFTLGSSAVGAAGDFYRDSFQAVERLGVRALFLTGSHAQGLPEKLPVGMLEWGYAPHSLVFPRAAVIVHQGGAGTTAEALRSGRPMLVVPFSHDQFDNAERCVRLGTGRWVARSAYGTSRAVCSLRELVRDATVEARCGEVAARIRVENGASTAADCLERLVGVRT